MKRNRRNILFELDWVLIILYLSLVVLGWFSIYITTYNVNDTGLFNLDTFYGKQLAWIGFSLILIVLVLSIETVFLERFAPVFYLFTLLLLLGLFALGKTINGQTAWYSFGGFSLQPAEFMKVTTSLVVSKLMGDNLFNIKKGRDIRNVVLLLFIPFMLILLQPDLGSGIIYFAFFFVMMREGLHIRLFFIFLILLFIFISTVKFGVVITLVISLTLLGIFYYLVSKRERLFFRKYWHVVIVSFGLVIALVFAGNTAFERVLKPHHKDRLALWLRLEKDPKKIRKLKQSYGFNNDQSIKTIASGGFKGKGFLEGDRTNGKFVPEQHTDYIFSAIGEEFGFIGSSIVVLLFVLLILRIIQKAEQQKTKFARIYGYSVASIFFVHFAINIGMVLDLLPTIGIPLPFFSYGGSSLWAFTILLFIFISLDANRLHEF